MKITMEFEISPAAVKGISKMLGVDKSVFDGLAEKPHVFKVTKKTIAQTDFINALKTSYLKKVA